MFGSTCKNFQIETFESVEPENLVRNNEMNTKKLYPNDNNN